MLGSAEKRNLRLIIREIIFEEFQRVPSQFTNVNVTDRRTDGRTTYHGIIVLPLETRGRVRAGASFQLGTLSTRIASRASLFIARTDAD